MNAGLTRLLLTTRTTHLNPDWKQEKKKKKKNPPPMGGGGEIQKKQEK